MPLYMCPAVAVDKVIIIGPESFSLPLVSSGEVQIMPPSAHTGIASVNTRLISAQCRSGQVHFVVVEYSLILFFFMHMRPLV